MFSAGSDKGARCRVQQVIFQLLEQLVPAYDRSLIRWQFYDMAVLCFPKFGQLGDVLVISCFLNVGVQRWSQLVVTLSKNKGKLLVQLLERGGDRHQKWLEDMTGLRNDGLPWFGAEAGPSEELSWFCPETEQFFDTLLIVLVKIKNGARQKVVFVVEGALRFVRILDQL